MCIWVITTESLSLLLLILLLFLSPVLIPIVPLYLSPPPLGSYLLNVSRSQVPYVGVGANAANDQRALGTQAILTCPVSYASSTSTPSTCILDPSGSGVGIWSPSASLSTPYCKPTTCVSAACYQAQTNNGGLQYKLGSVSITWTSYPGLLGLDSSYYYFFHANSPFLNRWLINGNGGILDSNWAGSGSPNYLATGPLTTVPSAIPAAALDNRNGYVYFSIGSIAEGSTGMSFSTIYRISTQTQSVVILIFFPWWN